jgi:hypothetical protein
VVGLPVLTLLCAVARAQPEEPFVLRSEAGRFNLRLTGVNRPEALNRLHGFNLSLTTADGSPAAGARIAVGGQRRYAPNQLPTAPQVRPGPVAGSYRVDGLRFHMAGEWRLVLDIELEQIHDRAVLDIVVK